MTTVIDMPPPQPRVHLRPEDVRLPQSPDEADMALDVCDANLASLENCIAHFKAQGFADQNLRAKLLKWEQRRAEIVYTVTRMNAGLPAIDPTIVDRYDNVLGQLVEARARITELERIIHDNDVRAKLRIAQLELAVAERADAAPVDDAPSPTAEQELTTLRDALARSEAAVARLTAAVQSRDKRIAGQALEIETQKKARATDIDRVRLSRGKMHENLARTVAALRSMVAAGAPLTPTAAQTLHACERFMPAGYFVTWMATHYPAFLAAALNSTERNGATCAEPAGTEGT